jgi:hypothetical protein
MYADEVQIIGGLCSPISMEEPSVEDYLNWLSEEMAGIPDMFCVLNENFAVAAIEGALVLVDDSVDLEAVQVAASEGGMDFCLLDQAFEMLPGLFQKSGGALSATTTCYLLSVLNKRRYFLIFDCGLGLTSQPCYCFVLGYDGKQRGV